MSVSDDDGRASPSLASSAPPLAEGEAVSAERLGEHPVWRAARGDGPRHEGRPAGRGRGKAPRPPSENGDPGDRPRFERISLAALEQNHYATGDGGDSRIDSDEEEEVLAPPRVQPDDAASVDDDDEEEDRPAKRDRLSGLMGAAAFGGAARHYCASDMGSAPSESSSRRRQQASKEAFPVRGVTCVGCALANRMGPVDRFVQQNISKMTEDSLWKMCALTYKKQVAEPAEREGATVPPFPWMEIRVHYELHNSGNFVSRHKMVRQLQCMRAQLETRLVRVDNGERELDRATADLMLKVSAPALPSRFLANTPVRADHPSRVPRAAAARAGGLVGAEEGGGQARARQLALPEPRSHARRRWRAGRRGDGDVLVERTAHKSESVRQRLWFWAQRGMAHMASLKDPAMSTLMSA
jgi:hypothetical protein